jgi:hypothetical protein
MSQTIQMAQIIHTNEFKALPLETQNQLLWDHLKEALTPRPAPQIIDVTPAQTEQAAAQPQPELVAQALPTGVDPNHGINTGGTNMITATLGSANDGLKNVLDMALGLVGAVGGLAVDIITLGQRAPQPRQE